MYFLGGKRKNLSFSVIGMMLKISIIRCNLFFINIFKWIEIALNRLFWPIILTFYHAQSDFLGFYELKVCASVWWIRLNLHVPKKKERKKRWSCRPLVAVSKTRLMLKLKVWSEEYLLLRWVSPENVDSLFYLVRFRNAPDQRVLTQSRSHLPAAVGAAVEVKGVRFGWDASSQ